MCPTVILAWMPSAQHWKQTWALPWMNLVPRDFGHKAENAGFGLCAGTGETNAKVKILPSTTPRPWYLKCILKAKPDKVKRRPFLGGGGKIYKIKVVQRNPWCGRLVGRNNGALRQG